jgi:hypothetical protein
LNVCITIINESLVEELAIFMNSYIIIINNNQALGDDTSNSSCSWAATKYFNNCTCVALDELMDMIGLKAVKQKALELFQTIRR